MSDVLNQTARTRLSSQLLHDLRSPLNQIIGYSEMLAEETGAERSGTLTGDLQKVRAAGHRLLALLDANFVAGPGATASDVEEPRAEWVPGEQKTVAPGLLLVVDDDATNRDVLSRRLERQGHEVRTAGSGEEALRLMREAPFETVLLDIMMPDMDGYEVLRQIKSDPWLEDVPVIMISAIDEVQSVVRCIEAGAEDYLAKPFDPTLLKARIGACLEKKRGRDRESILYEQLQRNYKRLLELEKMRDDMRNMIVHDLRTTLTSVIVGMEMVSSNGSLNRTQKEMMGIAMSGGRTLLGMINDLLDVEKMEAGAATLQYEPLSAPQLVHAAVEQVTPLATMERTTIATAIEPGLPAFAGDANKLTRTLVNLLANAIKFTRRGTVTIGASRHPSGGIQFSVRDTGQGIPAEAFDRIFEKFGQLDSESKIGTGLGLAFCKLAVEAHGGTIEVTSTIGEGSTFSFVLPVAR